MLHPWLSRRVVYPLQERLLKRPTFTYLERLEQSQWLSRTALERLQMKKLTELLGIAPGMPSEFVQPASASTKARGSRSTTCGDYRA